MKNPAMILPDAMRAIGGLLKVTGKGGVTSLFNRLNVTTRQVAGAAW